VSLAGTVNTLDISAVPTCQVRLPLHQGKMTLACIDVIAVWGPALIMAPVACSKSAKASIAASAMAATQSSKSEPDRLCSTSRAQEENPFADH
jgi:hypothetical protein